MYDAFPVDISGCYGYSRHDGLGAGPLFLQQKNTRLVNHPAYTGEEGTHQLLQHSRLQWWVDDQRFGKSLAYQTHVLGYHTSVNKYNSGIGGYLMHDSEGAGVMSESDIVLNYSYRLLFQTNHYLRLGVALNATQRTVDWGRLVFSDQLGGTRVGQVKPRSANHGENNESIIYPDFGGGLWYRLKDFRLGVSVLHINQPNISMSKAGESRLPLRVSIQAAYRHTLDTGAAVMPMARYWQQGGFRIVDLGVRADVKQFRAGLFYKIFRKRVLSPDIIGPNQALGLMLGVELFSRLECYFSYDLPPSRFMTGSTEWGLRYNVGKPVENDQ